CQSQLCDRAQGALRRGLPHLEHTCRRWETTPARQAMKTSTPPVAAAIARARRATVLLLCVIDLGREVGLYVMVPGPAVESTVQSLRTTAKDYLTEQAKGGVVQGIPTERVVVLGSDAHGILATAASGQVDLILLCSHGRTGLARWALGSVAEHVARHAPVPVLVLREQEPRSLASSLTPSNAFACLSPWTDRRWRRWRLSPPWCSFRRWAHSRPQRSTS